MKAPKPPTPEKCSAAPAATPKTALAVNPANPWTQSYLRLATFHWEPPSLLDAKQMALECMSRAQSVASVVAEAIGHGDVDASDISNCLALISDLVHIVPILDWWSDEDQLTALGWTPPTGVQP
ncbi:MAG TPA: hypothetical protein VGC99_29080 [Candidatus Tectomicrobia bacterium]